MPLGRKVFFSSLLFILSFGLLSCSVKRNEVKSEADASALPEKIVSNGDVMILFTSDVHCGIDQGFGYAGLWQVRKHLEEEGFTTILVDSGDSVQGEAVGMLSKGDAIIELMNDMRYDVAIPGNHEFDYGMDKFLEFTKKADFPYISCNFNKEGKLLLPPYVIKEAAGIKIAFVGVVTPMTFTSSTPVYFQDESGKFIYNFKQDLTGDPLYVAVQDAVDSARAEGADYVYLLAHLGNGSDSRPWSFADVVSHTNGIDVVLDGHSHDTEQLVMKNKDGKPVVRSAVGTKLNSIGYSHISAKEGIVKTNIWTCTDKELAADFIFKENEISKKVASIQAALNENLSRVLAKSPVTLSCQDVRRLECSLGDLCADAFRAASGADIAFVNGGGIRADIKEGEVTYGEIIDVFPFGNHLSVIRVTGQQVLDALEWTSRYLPVKKACFLQVSGISYEVDVSVPSGCIEDEYKMCIGIEGERRVKNVRVGGREIDSKKLYTLAGPDYVLLFNGDGITAFNGAEVLRTPVKTDSQVLMDYISNNLSSAIGEEYSNPQGQGRIRIIGN